MGDLFNLPFEEDDDEALEPVPLPQPAASLLASAATPPSNPDDAGPGTMPVLARRVLTVTELTVRLRDLVDREFYDVWIEGEISNCRLWNTGHLYFTLKDRSAQLRAVVFRSALRFLKFKPGDGLRVVARGRVAVYEPKGEYQLVCEHLEPQGLGALQLAVDQLKARLQQEGLFDASRKRPLPALPRKIGIVTSLDGAAIRDIIKVLTRRHANVHLVIRPTRVQGTDARADIARALRAIATVPGVDVVIVGRGGGSIEDLWCFNEEVVARAIARCPIPVISAVGHESDVTVADLVADVRAPTPSAAAELVVGAKDEFCARIDRLRDRLRAAIYTRVQLLSRRVFMLTSRSAFGRFPGRLALRARDAAELAHALATLGTAQLATRRATLAHYDRQLAQYDLRRRLGPIRTRLVTGGLRLAAAMARRYRRAEAHLSLTASRLDALSPLAVLGRGYAVCWNRDRTAAIRDAAEVASGDRVVVTLARGELDCEVRAAAAAGTGTDSDD